jgi:hypothetical protein
MIWGTVRSTVSRMYLKRLVLLLMQLSQRKMRRIPRSYRFHSVCLSVSQEIRPALPALAYNWIVNCKYPMPQWARRISYGLSLPFINPQLTQINTQLETDNLLYWKLSWLPVLFCQVSCLVSAPLSMHKISFWINLYHACWVKMHPEHYIFAQYLIIFANFCLKFQECLNFINTHRMDFKWVNRKDELNWNCHSPPPTPLSRPQPDHHRHPSRRGCRDDP